MHKHKLDLAVEAEDTERGNLYISGVHGAKSLENLQAVNIVAVLSVISARELQHFNLGPLYEHGQISHLHIDADDDQETDLVQNLAKGLEFLRSHLKMGNVLVHCFAGVSRSASFVCYYIMAQHKLSFDNALEQLRKRRQIVRPNPGFTLQLRMLEQSLLSQEHQKKSQPASQN